MQEKLHLFFYSASGLFFLFSFLSFPFLFFFFSSKGTIIWSQCSSVPDGRKYTGWAIFFKEFLKTMGEIYLQGKSTAKTQAVCLELRSPLLHFKVSPPHPAFPPPPPSAPHPSRRSHYWRLYGRGAVKSLR